MSLLTGAMNDNHNESENYCLCFWVNLSFGHTSYNWTNDAYVWLFGCVEIKIDFKRVGFYNLILMKGELKVNWFIFNYINIKSDLTLNLCIKIKLYDKNYKS